MKLLTEKQLLYPEDLAPLEVVRRVKATLEASDEILLNDPRLDLENFIQRMAWIFGVSPILLLLGLQREQSLLSKNGQQESERAYSRAEGVVGQHVPGTANPLWDGLPSQIFMSARSAAWVSGIGAKENFGYKPGLWPTVARWTPVDAAAGCKILNLLNLDGSFNRKHTCADRMEYEELAYTPSAILDKETGQLDVRTTNSKIYFKYLAAFWGDL